MLVSSDKNCIYETDMENVISVCKIFQTWLEQHYPPIILCDSGQNLDFSFSP